MKNIIYPPYILTLFHVVNISEINFNYLNFLNSTL